MFARFDENPAMTLRVIKETKRYGRTDVRTDGRTHGRTDNVKTVYPLQTKFAGGIKKGQIGFTNSGQSKPLDKSVQPKINFISQNIYCGYSKELSHQESSFEYPKQMLKLMNKKIFAILR